MKAACTLLLCVVFLVLPSTYMNGTRHEMFTISLPTIYTCRVEPQTIEEQILAVLIDSGYSILEQGIILAQSKHESGHYTNSISKKNNVFSLYKGKTSTYPLEEKVRAEGCTCFAAYRTIQEATLDFLQLRTRQCIQPELSVEAYVTFLKSKNYFMDDESRYLRSIKQLIKRDESLVLNFNARYPGIRIYPTAAYTITEVTSILSTLMR